MSSLGAYELFFHSVTVITIVVQIYLFYLIEYTSPPNMKEYRPYLNYFTFWDLILSIFVGSILQPEPIGHLSFTKSCGLASLFEPKVQIFAVSFVIYSAVNAILSQDFCLIYRFVAVHKNQNWKQVFVAKRAKILCVIFGQIFSVFTATMLYNTLLDPKHWDADHLNPQQQDDLRNSVPPGQFVFVPNRSSPFMKGFFLSMLSLLVFSESLSGYIIYSIVSTLKRNSKSYSKHTYRLHFNLSVLLSIQLLIPIVLLIIPTLFRWLKGFIGIESGTTSSQIGFMLVSVYGLTNSILTLLFVTPYRMHIYNNLIYPWYFPILRKLKLEKFAVKRKSIAWVSTTRVDLRNVTIFKNN